VTVETHRFDVATRGDTHVVDLTDAVIGALLAGTIRNGIVTVFAVGSTAGVTTTEFEPGLVHTDLRTALQRVAPEDGVYQHELTWHDDNGHAHVRATLVGPSLTVPLVDGRPTLGTWQQIVLMDFDTRGRHRQIVIQVMGE
jgi:secondary thiamine-phosphate synthase enzyme